MIGYTRRTAPVIVRALLGRDGALVSRIERRVRLGELDANLHMNQAVYAQVMELGRADWMIRSRTYDRWRAQKVNPVVANQRLIYRRELKLGTRYTIDTRATGVHGRLMAMEGNLIVGQRVHARCEAEVIFVSQDGVLDAEQAQRICEGVLVEPLAVEDWALV